MLDGIYECRMNTPMGEIKGNITLVTKESKLFGIIETMGMKNEFKGGSIHQNTFEFKGEVATVLGHLEYYIMGKVVNGQLEIIAKTNKGEFAIHGKKR